MILIIGNIRTGFQSGNNFWLPSLGGGGWIIYNYLQVVWANVCVTYLVLSLHPLPTYFASLWYQVAEDVVAGLKKCWVSTINFCFYKWFIDYSASFLFCYTSWKVRSNVRLALKTFHLLLYFIWDQSVVMTPFLWRGVWWLTALAGPAVWNLVFVPQYFLAGSS